MDELFSSELKELMSNSREVAIDLGYDYITTIHMFIANCDVENPKSILQFAFPNKNKFEEFKKAHTLGSVNLLDLIDAPIPLTVEAEKAIRQSIKESQLHRQTEVYPCHLFLAALKDKESLLSTCFKHDENVVDKLMNYYSGLGEFEKSKMTAEQISMLSQQKTKGFFSRIKKYFK